MKTLLISFCFFLASSFTHYPAHKTFFNAYDVQLVSNNGAGSNYEWIWKVTNPDPGNGLNGTLQDLSHWSLILPECITQSNIVSAAYSHDGLMWTPLSSSIGVDPSQGCYTAAVLKFDVGFSGTTTMYYKLVVNQPYIAGVTTAVFKSGKRTGCYVGMIEGITCDPGGIIRE
jgi:hypothetical protein